MEAVLHPHLHCSQSPKRRRFDHLKAIYAVRQTLSQSAEKIPPISYVVTVCNVNTLLDERVSFTDMAFQIIACGFKKLHVFIPNNHVHPDIGKTFCRCYGLILYRRQRTQTNTGRSSRDESSSSFQVNMILGVRVVTDIDLSPPPIHDNRDHDDDCVDNGGEFVYRREGIIHY